MIVVIDGPAGSGKSTTARAVADQLQIEYLDSGAIYRAVTALYLRKDGTKESFFRLLKKTKLTCYYQNQQFNVEINDKPLTDDIRSAKVSNMVSEVAAWPEVRAFVNKLMHRMVTEGAYIAEGRDLGTAVFPDAELKFYMSADVDERARRRYRERKNNDSELTLKDVKENILHRDEQDSGRKEDPLKKADDAIEIDTTDLTFEQQVDQICLKIKSL